MKKRPIDFLRSPWVVFSGMIAGIIIGIKYDALALKLAPFGNIYLSLLQMCIVPIMITAVVSSIGRLLTTAQASKYIGRLVIVFLLGMVFASILGLTIGIFAKPGKGLGETNQIVLGKKIYEAEMCSDSHMSEFKGFVSLIHDMVPTNIFAAISKGQNLAILMFSVLLGISLGLIRSPSSNTSLSVIDAFYDAFLNIIGWLIYGLPFGLLCLLADNVSKIGIDVVFAMLRLVLFVYLCAMILLVIYSLTIWKRAGGSYWSSISALRETLLVALGTSSSFASIPSALRGLHDNLKFEKKTSDLVIPLGVNLNPHGTVVHFAISIIFIAQIYAVSLGFKELLIVIIGSILAGLAATSAPGLAGLSMISIVLIPLGLPYAVAVILLAAIDPILDPILTTVNVYGNCAATALIAKRKKGRNALSEN